MARRWHTHASECNQGRRGTALDVLEVLRLVVHEAAMLRRHRLWLLCLSIACTGCMFRELGRNLEVRGHYAVLRGEVAVDPPRASSVVVVAYSGDPGAERVVDAFVLARPGPYFFVLPGGTYRIAAFEDVRGDLSYDPDADPAALLRAGAPLEAEGGQTLAGLDLTLRRDAADTLPFRYAADEREKGPRELFDSHIGDVVGIDDPRFSDQHAEDGLWRPAQFVFDVGPGIYLLEPYDPDKEPVLFIHGALGHPGVWREMIDRLDRSRFQPWLAYYPTAARLEVAAQAIDRWMQRLYVEHRFTHFAVVAHSMGGLVARAFLNRLLDAHGEQSPAVVRLFISLSTPWQGHEAAGRGVERAPVVAPSWYDMAPGSLFLEALLAHPLPPSVGYDLLFTYGDSSPLLGDANDGAVTLNSQLDPRAQQQAKRMYGFDVGHGAILRSPQAAAVVNGLLAADGG
jgi:pimeloyl-ACP methyl ester carboxylesterase